MVTIHREGSIRVMIFSDDHEPAQVHVFGEGHAKINLTGRNGLAELVWVDRMKHREAQKAMSIVVENRQVFLERWRDIHG